jgi:co-chaperonin GroES (HSP10)
MAIKFLVDYFTVSIEHLYEEKKSKSGIIAVNTAWIDEEEGERFNHKRIYGTVLSVPKSYSQNAYRAIDSGMPAYRKFIGHEEIVDKINRGYRNHAEKSYYPSTFDKYNVVTMEDVGKRVNIRVGDKIYFMPQVTEDVNFVSKEDGKMIYKVPVTEIIFNSTTGMTQGEWVLVEPVRETWDDVTTASGIITKSKLDNKWLEGVVWESGYDFCKPGMRILYLPNADCPVTVEGKELFVMPVQDIMGELN